MRGADPAPTVWFRIGVVPGDAFREDIFVRTTAVARLLGVGAAAVLAGSLAVGPASADHSLKHNGKALHWAQTSSAQLKLTIQDSVTRSWNDELRTANSDWNRSTRVENTVVASGTTASTRDRCAPGAGKIRVCNYAYGKTGWLGLAGVAFDRNGHITKGNSMMNESYSMSAAMRQSVMCQEIGHDFGLDHQDENFGNRNLGTCMDYTSRPKSNQHPNKHDYDQLVRNYDHTHGSAAGQTIGSRSSSVIRTGQTLTRIFWKS